MNNSHFADFSVCVCACVCACVRACVCVCVCQLLMIPVKILNKLDELTEIG